MTRRRRKQETELNLDGLTDPVTNLAGGLLLLVVLLAGITSPHMRSALPMPPLPAAPDADERRGPVSTLPVLQKLQRLRAETDATGQQITAIQQRIRELRTQLETLTTPPREPEPAVEPETAAAGQDRDDMTIGQVAASTQQDVER